MSKINIRESLRNMDADSCCKYDLLTMYDACPLTDEDKADIAKLLFDNEDPEVIYQKLCTYFCDDDVSELTGLTDVQNVTPFEAIINNVKMGLDQKYDSVFYNDVAGQFEITSKDTTYTFGLSPVEYETDGIPLYVEYNYDMPINYTSIKEASEDILNKCNEKVSAASQSNGYVDDDTMDYTVYDVVEDEGRLCAKCMNESTNSFEDIKLGKVNSDAVNKLLNNILNNPNYKLTDDCKRKIANNSAPWGIVMSPSFDITASNALMSTGDFGGSVSFGESEQCTFENGDRVTDGNRKGTVIDCDSIKVLVDWDYSDTDDIEWVMKEDLSFIDSLKESTDEEVDIENPEQEFSSAATSINSTKLPAIYNMVEFRPGDVVVDFGGGKFDNAVNYLKDKDVTLLVYDPYNRSAEHNKEVLRILKEHGGADAAVNSNVLNVIKEPEAREAVLRNIKKITKRGAPIYITVYEGRGDGAEGPTKSGYQLNRKTADYLDEIREVFPDANRKGKLIVATNSRTLNSSTNIKASSTEGYVYTYCDECGKKNRVKVTFNNFNEPFNDTEYKCKYCGANNLLTDPHSYDKNGNLVEASHDEICKAISGDKSAIQSLKKQGYKINRLANPLQISEVGTYEITDTSGNKFNYDNTIINDSADGARVRTESGYQLNNEKGDYMNESIVTDASNIGQGYAAPIMVSLVTKAKELKKWAEEYKNSKDKDVFERLLPSFEDNILDYKSDIEEKIKDFDKYWEVHKKAMLDNISEAVSILKNIGIPRLDSKLEKLNESYSDSADTRWMAKYKDLKGIKHKVWTVLPTSNFEEAEEMFEDIIAEPHTNFILLGTAPHRSALEADGFEYVDSKVLYESYFSKDVEEFLDEVGGFTDYDGKVEELRDHFGMTKDEAESAIQRYVIEPDDDYDIQEIEESYSNDEWIDKMWEAFQGISGIEDISEGKKPNTCIVTFDSEGSATARARVLLKALIKANLDIELDSTNGSNVFTFITPNSEWEFVKGKMIKDSDGFLTSYDWYRNTDSGLNIFMLGYDEADPDYADWETESDTEAEDWFKSYNGFDEDEIDESLGSSSTAEVISKELKDAAYKLFKTPKWGFESDKEIKDYINPIFDVSEDPKTGDLEVQVRAELDYDNLVDLSNALNKVVSKYDKDAYFDAEQPGIITAVISYS